MTRYETTFILSPDLEEAELEKNIERYAGIITGRGGTIVKHERWGMRRLAYQIKKKSTGYYTHLVHDSGPDVPRELERQFLLNENCLRYLTVRAEQRTAEVEFKAPLGRVEGTGFAGPGTPSGATAGREPDAKPAVAQEEKPGDWSTAGDQDDPDK